MGLLLFLSVIFVTPSHAYLDPGTGSMLVSTIIALVATLMYSLKSFSFKIKSFIFKLFGGKVEKIENSDIVIYNEGNQYASTFSPVIEELIKRNIKFTYLYSEKDDPIIDKFKKIDSHFIDYGNKAFFYLNTLNAKFCLMTTPGLDVLQIKRSKGVQHYCHISHSTGGCRYEVFGVDYYDSVLVPNIYDKRFIEGLENKRNISKKEIYTIGTPYLDYKIKEISEKETSENNKTTILISPTWGEHGLLSLYGEEIISILLSSDNNYNIIIRPHPQTISYESEILENLKNKFSDNDNIYWDYDNDTLLSMNKSDLMISDFSGIILDYMFLYSKPVISLPGTIDLRGKDYIEKDIPLWQIDFYNKFTMVLKSEEISRLDTFIEKAINTDIKIENELKNEYNPYLGSSAIETVNSIENIVKNLKSEES